MNKNVVASISMLLGPILVFGLVLAMNRYASDLDKQKPVKTTQLDIVKQVKPKAKKKIKKARPKRVRKTARAPVPFKGLNSSLSGIDLGIPGLGDGALDDLNSGLLGKTGSSIMTEDLVDVAPKPKSRGSFKYPSAAKKKGIKGYVILSLLIDERGNVDQVQVLESSPTGVFDEAAIQGINSWRFEPAKYEGKNVKVWAKQKIRFDLSS
ncbi:energy transducer TonB [Methyloprofundus sp.]|uniref:energy transducer TonB n=1 Tax=Methyloprofundus sp. TaxID=2020875 RepID=UPI003D0ACC33